MRVAERVDEDAGLEPAHLRHRHGQQRVGGDVERHAEEDVGRALIELARQRAVGDVELEQAMARRQRHRLDLRRVPGGDDEPARGRVAADLGEHIGELVDAAAVRRRPGAPLLAVDRAEIAVLVGPFVPDGDAVLVEIFDVGFAAQEPEQFVDDRFQMQLLGGEQRKAGGKVEPHLMAEDRAGADAGAVALLHALGEHAVHEVEILAHCLGSLAGSGRVAATSLTSNERRTKPAQDRGG